MTSAGLSEPATTTTPAANGLSHLNLKLPAAGSSRGASHRLSISNDPKLNGQSNPWAGTLNWGNSEMDGMAGAASLLRLRPDSTATPHTAAGRRSLSVLGGWDGGVSAFQRTSLAGTPTAEDVDMELDGEEMLMRGRRSVSVADFDRPATMSARRLSRRQDSPLPVLDSVSRANDALYPERNALAAGGRALTEHASSLSVALRSAKMEITDISVHVREQEQRAGTLAAKRDALLAELALLQAELEAPPPAALSSGAALAMLEVATKRIYELQRPLLNGTPSRGDRGEAGGYSRGGTSRGAAGGTAGALRSAAGGASGMRGTWTGQASTSDAFPEYGADFSSSDINGRTLSPMRRSTTTSPMRGSTSPMRNATSPMRGSTSPTRAGAGSRGMAASDMGMGSSMRGAGVLSPSATSDALLMGEEGVWDDQEVAALEYTREQCQAALNQLLTDAKTTKAKLQQQLVDMSAVAVGHRGRLGELRSAHQVAVARLRAVTSTHVQLQSHQLDMLTRDGASGTSIKTRAIIEAVSRDATRKGRVMARPPGAGRPTTPGTGHLTTAGAILRGSPRGEQPPAQPDDSKLYGDADREVALLEVLSPVKRLVRLHELSSRFSRAGVLAANLHVIMEACAGVNSLDNVTAALEALVQLGQSLLGAEKLLMYRCKSGMYWCVTPEADRSAPRHVDRGVVAYVAQSAATLHTPALRKSHVYDHDSEDVKVPHIPHTPALAMAVRDPSCPHYPVGGQLPGKLVMKAVGKATCLLGEPSGFTARDMSMMKVLGSLFERLVDNWDAISKIQLLNSRLERMLDNTRAVLQQQDPLQQLFDLAAAAVDVLHGEAAVLYVLDRQRSELVGYCSGPDRRRIRRPLIGALGQVFTSGRLLNLAEVGHVNDKTYSTINDSPPGVVVQNALLAPVAAVGSGNKLMGLVQVVNKRHVEGSVLNPREVQHPVFDGDDEEIIRGVAAAITGACSTCGALNTLLDKQAGNDPIYACRYIHDVCRKLGGTLKESLQCEGVRVFMVKPEQQQLHVPVSANEDLLYPMNVGISGRAVMTGRVQQFSSRAEDTRKSTSGAPSAHHSVTWVAEGTAGVAGHPADGAAEATTSAADNVWDVVDEQVYDLYVDAASHSPSSVLAVPLLDPGTGQVHMIVTAVNKRHTSFMQADILTIRAAAGRASMALLSAAALEAVESTTMHSAEVRTYFTKLVAEARDFRRMGAVVEDLCQNMTRSDMCVLALKAGVDAPPPDLLQRAQSFMLSSRSQTTRQGFEGGDGLICPAGAMSDGHGHPEIMERAADVVRKGEILDEVEGSHEARDEYNGKSLPFRFRYYIPIRNDSTNEVLGVLGVEREGFNGYDEQQRQLLHIITQRVAMLIRHGKLFGGTAPGTAGTSASQRRLSEGAFGERGGSRETSLMGVLHEDGEGSEGPSDDDSNEGEPTSPSKDKEPGIISTVDTSSLRTPQEAAM